MRPTSLPVSRDVAYDTKPHAVQAGQCERRKHHAAIGPECLGAAFAEPSSHVVDVSPNHTGKDSGGKNGSMDAQSARGVSLDRSMSGTLIPARIKNDEAGDAPAF